MLELKMHERSSPLGRPWDNRAPWVSRRGLFFATLTFAGACLFLVVLFELPSWSLSLVLLAALSVGVIPSVVSTDTSVRLGTFFALLAICDFVKRLTFLTSDQALWSQYVTFVFPYAYYCVFILLPFCLSPQRARISRAGVLSALYVVVALVNTWLSSDFTVLSKLTASALLIVPWTMLLVGATHSHSLYRVARVLVVCGLVSAVYGLSQLAFGPTVVEVRWAEAAGGFSIGASRLASFLGSTAGDNDIWRVNGLQPDALTFGILMMTALASCQVLRCERKMRAAIAWGVTCILIAAIASSMVRTIWVSCLAFAAFAYFAGRFRFLLRPKVFVALLVGVFVASDYSAAYLRDQTLSVANVDNPYVARAMLMGTLEARKNALQNLEEILPKRILLGSGYAASPWVGGKFGEDENLQRDLAASTSHNVMLELLWYVGLPGILLFLLLLYEISRCACLVLLRAEAPRKKTIVVLGAYVVGMFVSGLGNGGVFLGFYFFFFSGVIVAQGMSAPRAGRPAAAV